MDPVASERSEADARDDGVVPYHEHLTGSLLRIAAVPADLDAIAGTFVRCSNRGLAARTFLPSRCGTKTR